MAGATGYFGRYDWKDTPLQTVTEPHQRWSLIGACGVPNPPHVNAEAGKDAQGAENPAGGKS